MNRIVYIFIILIYSGLVQANQESNKIYTEKELREMLRDAAIIDGNYGISIKELNSVFGIHNRMEDSNTMFESGASEYVWQLNSIQHIQASPFNGIAGNIRLFENGNENWILLWK